MCCGHLHQRNASQALVRLPVHPANCCPVLQSHHQSQQIGRVARGNTGFQRSMIDCKDWCCCGGQALVRYENHTMGPAVQAPFVTSIQVEMQAKHCCMALQQVSHTCSWHGLSADEANCLPVCIQMSCYMQLDLLLSGQQQCCPQSQHANKGRLEL